MQDRLSLILNSILSDVQEVIGNKQKYNTNFAKYLISKYCKGNIDVQDEKTKFEQQFGKQLGLGESIQENMKKVNLTELEKLKVKKFALQLLESRNLNEGDNPTEDKLEALFTKLVPGSGAAKTMEGEMVRAMMRIMYRYFNDGDYYFRGYGKETVAPSVKWLIGESPIGPELAKVFRAARSNALRSNHPDEFDDEKDFYLIGLRNAAELVVDYVESRKGKYTPNESGDSR